MARSVKRHFRKAKTTIPLAIVAGFVPGAMSIYAHRGNGIEGMAAEASRVFLGYASTNKYGYNDSIGFHPYLLSYGTGPVLAGFLAHWIASKTGVNRMIARSGIPFIRI